MSNYRQQAQLDVPLDEVWRLVGDVRQHPRWWPHVVDIPQCEGIEQGCRYRQVTKQPIGQVETTMSIERVDSCREILVRCLDLGTYARWLLTESQGGTFLDVEFGMNPKTVRHRVFDTVAGRRYFRRWLEQSIDALRAASAATPEPATAGPPPPGAPPSSTGAGG